MSYFWVLLVNAVPLFGLAFLGWNGFTIIVVFWLENALLQPLCMWRIASHWRTTRLRGHLRRPTFLNKQGQLITRLAAPDQGSQLLDGVGLLVLGAFTLVHGLFVGGMVFMHYYNASAPLPWAEFATAGALMAAVVVSDAVIDRLQMARKTYAWVEKQVHAMMLRIVVVHLALIAGVIALGVTGGGLWPAVILMVLKILFDLLLVRSERASPDAIPAGIHELAARFDAKNELDELWAYEKHQQQLDELPIEE